VTEIIVDMALELDDAEIAAAILRTNAILFELESSRDLLGYAGMTSRILRYSSGGGRHLVASPAASNSHGRAWDKPWTGLESLTSLASLRRG
jgi:hypothetical protein